MGFELGFLGFKGFKGCFLNPLNPNLNPNLN
jgi:hypothetical protein